MKPISRFTRSINLLFPSTVGQKILPNLIREVLKNDDCEHLDTIEALCIKNWNKARQYKCPSTYFRKSIVTFAKRLAEKSTAYDAQLQQTTGGHLRNVPEALVEARVEGI